MVLEKWVQPKISMIFFMRECAIHGHLHRIRYVPNGSNFFVRHRLQSSQETARWLCSPEEYLELVIKISLDKLNN